MQQRKASPHPSEEGRALQPQFSLLGIQTNQSGVENPEDGRAVVDDGEYEILC